MKNEALFAKIHTSEKLEKINFDTYVSKLLAFAACICMLAVCRCRKLHVPLPESKNELTGKGYSCERKASLLGPLLSLVASLNCFVPCTWLCVGVYGEAILGCCCRLICRRWLRCCRTLHTNDGFAFWRSRLRNCWRLHEKKAICMFFDEKTSAKITSHICALGGGIQIFLAYEARKSWSVIPHSGQGPGRRKVDIFIWRLTSKSAWLPLFIKKTRNHRNLTRWWHHSPRMN